MLVREQLARPAETRLHFIQHQQYPSLVAPGADLRQVVVVRDVDAAFSLKWFQKHRRCPAARGLLDRLSIVERHADEALHKRRERRAVLLVARRRHRCEGTPVERVFRDDDLERAVALLLAPLARDLEQALDSLRAAIAEEDLVEPRTVAQELRQLHLRDRVVVVRGVHQLPRLPFDRSYDFRMAVAKAHRSNSRDEIEILAAIEIPDMRALSAHQRNRQPLAGRQEVFLFQFDPVLFFGHAMVVPIICPSILRSKTCSFRPSTIRHFLPACAALRHARTFGIIPPSITPLSMNAPACSDESESAISPSPMRTPGTSVRNTSRPAPSAFAIAPAALSALMFRSCALGLSPFHSRAIGAITGMIPWSSSEFSGTTSTPVISPTNPSFGSNVRARSRPLSAPERPFARAPSELSSATISLFTSPVRTATTTFSDSASVTRKPCSKRVGRLCRASQ